MSWASGRVASPSLLFGDSAATTEFTLNGQVVGVPEGMTVAAAIACQSPGYSRVSVIGQVRAPFCSVGTCHECRLMIDERVRLACQTLCRDRMRVETKTKRVEVP